jgi:hypothetical protein
LKWSVLSFRLALQNKTLPKRRKTMLIFEVTQVTVIKASSSPLKLEIHASGFAATSGWTNPKLDPVATPPGDPILEFNFDATPPDGISLPVLTPIQAATEVEPPNPVAGVTVIARTNRITIHASQFSSGQFTTHIAGEEHPTTEAVGPGSLTTLIAGEEHPTTQALGEEHPTTLAVGEEGPTTLIAGEEHPTTQAIGEEHPTTLPAGEEHPTTLAIGEEHPTTLIAGEENPTTQAIGEEHPTTLAVGEEHPTTLIAGEENPTTQAVGEEHPTTTLLGEEHLTTFIVGEEHPTTYLSGEESTTNPQLDDPAGGGFTTLAVGEEHGGGPFGGF